MFQEENNITAEEFDNTNYNTKKKHILLKNIKSKLPIKK